MKYKLKPYKKHILKELLANKTGCIIQHNGWTCGTCFFAISDKLTNKDWQTILAIRGDYELEDLNNLPKDIDKRLEKIIKIIKNEPLSLLNLINS